jgi:DNA-binding NtrC family response regulator
VKLQRSWQKNHPYLEKDPNPSLRHYYGSTRVGEKVAKKEKSDLLIPKLGYILIFSDPYRILCRVMDTLKILICVNHKPSEKILKKALEDRFELIYAKTKEELVAQITTQKFQFGFLDMQSLISNGESNVSLLLEEIWHIQSGIEIITLTQPTDQATLDAVKSVQKGAFRYLTLPLIESEVRLLLQSFFEQEKILGELDYLREKLNEPGQYVTVQTNSPKMKKLYEQVQRVSETNSNIFINGETGTGKSLLAKLIHQNSPRKNKPFIGLHCGAIPDALLESELFGYEKGGFTDAHIAKPGKFELAHMGTIFLDEVGTMPVVSQIKLLQIIQDRKNIRIGGVKERDIDVRIISASNEDLKMLADQGRFRNDLYYRLNVFPVTMPSLKERKEDIPLFVNVFLKKLNGMHQKSIQGVSPKAMDSLMKYHWPGNIRELENVLERAFILETSDVLQSENFPSEFQIVDRLEDATNFVDVPVTLKEFRVSEINRIEKIYLKTALGNFGGRISDTAKSAGISTRQLHKLMTKHGVTKEEFKPGHGIAA